IQQVLIGALLRTSIARPELAENLDLARYPLMEYAACTSASRKPIISTVMEEKVAWLPTDELFLSNLGPQFHDNVSVLLHRAGAGGLINGVRRLQLNNLLFQPLQNARDYGRPDDEGVDLRGIALQLISSIQPQTASVHEYLSELKKTTPGFDGMHLEFLIHDFGPGIARHYYRSRQQAYGEDDLFTGHIVREWFQVKAAFERHSTSKYFAQKTSRIGYEPGVGLAGLMSALKQLHAYAEIRTGRLRVYRWFRVDEIVARADLLLPAVPPSPSSCFSGTMVRLLVPVLSGE
ncbi:MAG TPA: hypothetical protein VFE05_05320, partial [Longimicrobiaceae bacterium]|nr:hypothetical protein [Longimicrobiaceae bacterium]